MIKNRPPDFIDNDGDEFWYDEDGKCHNDFGPAVIWANGGRSWYINGLRHNENGPAEVYSDGSKKWYINDQYYSEEDFKQYKIKQFIDDDKE